MFISQRIELLFPTRLVVTDIEAAPLNAALREQILAMAAVVPTTPRGEVVGWQSDNGFFETGEAAAALRHLIVSAALGAFEETAALEGCHIEGWANVLRQDEYFSPHTHAGGAFSGVYYVDAGQSGEAGGGLFLRDPRAGSGMVESHLNRFDTGCAYRVLPRTGQLLVFPSWLLHWVSPYRGEEPRISVSFNIW